MAVTHGISDVKSIIWMLGVGHNGHARGKHESLFIYFMVHNALHVVQESSNLTANVQLDCV